MLLTQLRVLACKTHSLWVHLIPLWAGELALEEHSGSGPAVDAEVSEAQLVHQLLPHTLRAGRLEETLHPDCAGTAAHLAAGLEIASTIS